MNKNVNTQDAKARPSRAVFAVAGVLVVLGAAYLYATNKVAVQGYAIRSAENEAAQLKQDNNRLRIEEAELKSLYRIEEAGKRLNMFEPTEVNYIEDANSVALMK